MRRDAACGETPRVRCRGKERGLYGESTSSDRETKGASAEDSVVALPDAKATVVVNATPFVSSPAPFICIEFEHVDSLRDVDEILALDGYDAVMVGAADLGSFTEAIRKFLADQESAR